MPCDISVARTVSSDFVTTGTFGVLGPLVVHDASGPRPIAAPKLRVVLAALLLRAPHVVGVDELADLVWGEHQPTNARGALNTYLNRLRQALGGELRGRIRTVAPGYLIDLNADEFDVHRFTALRQQGAALLAAGDPAAGAAALRRALGEWHGDVLADVPCDRLVAEHGNRLTELRTETWEEYIGAEIAAGNHAGVLDEARRQVSAHPLRERLHEHLLLALYRCGRRGDALAAYQAAYDLLVAELGIEPGARLRRLQQQILSDSPPPGTDDGNPPPAAREPIPAAAAPAAQRWPVPAQLPGDIGDFTGRSAESAMLVRELADGAADAAAAPAVATVTGPGGVGKTTLAVHVAHRIRELFPDGQIFVHLGGTSELPMRVDDVRARILRELGVDPARIPADPAERANLYRSILAERRILLVLDDARDSPHVRALIPGSTGCAVLVTSRNRLATLSTCARVDLDTFTETPARALFTRIVGAARAEAEPKAVGRVLDACSGLPLAIRIAAARLVARPNSSVAALAERLADVRARLDQLEAEDLGVRAAFANSYERLAPASGAADAFRALGLWPAAEVSADAVAALVGRPSAEVEGALDALAEAQLLEVPAVDRYRLHDLLRVYAHERALAQDPVADRERVCGRIVSFYLHSLWNACQRLRPQRVPLPVGTPAAAVAPRDFADHADAVAWTDAEQPNIVAAIRVAETGALFDAGWQLAFAIWPYYYLTKRCDEWLDTAAAGLRCAAGTGNRSAIGAALWNLGTALCESHRYDEAVAHYVQALEHQRAAGDTDREPSTLNSLAVAYAESGRPAEALGVFTSLHDLNLRREDTLAATICLLNMAMCNLELGRPEIAVEYNRRVVEEFRRRGDPYMEAVALANQAEAYASLDADDLAAAAYQEAIVLHELAGNRHGLGRALTGLGRQHAKTGHLADARSCWLQALAIFEDLGHPDAAEARDLLQAPVRLSG